MRKRYDLRRSDNYMVTGRVSYAGSGSGAIVVVTGFPVMRANVSFSTIPTETTAGLNTSSSESSGEDWPTLPRVYVSSYTDTGFIVAYEGIPEDIGYIEFCYSAV